MAGDDRLICASAELADGGSGKRFELPSGSPGFAVRHRGAVRGYVNRCPHASTELDWQPGEFFEESGLYLICSTHGAIFEPGSGLCIAGPCRGESLEALAIRERGGQVVLLLNKAPANHNPKPRRDD